MRNWFFRGFSFRNKLIVSFVFVSLLPVLIVQMIYYYISSNAMETKINELVHYNLIQTSKSLDSMLMAYEDILFQVFTNDDIVHLVRNINNGSDVELSKNQLVNILSSYSYAKEGIRSVAIFTKNGTLICYDLQTGSPYQNLWSNAGSVTQLPLYGQVMNQRQPTVMTLPTMTDSINNKEQYIFHIARKMNDFQYNTDGIGIVVISLYESVLSNAVNMSSETTDSASQIRSANFLTDGDNRIVSSPDKSYIGQDIGIVYQKETISNDYRNDKRGLHIINITNKQDLFREMYAMQRISLITGLSALLMSSLLIIYLSGSLTKSIKTILRAMKTAQQGTLTVQIADETKDEMSLIAFSFNNMMNTINDLMHESRQAALKQKESEIRALEAQINPHFLYNTLDSINWLAIDKEEHQISEMLKGLAQILRYSIKDSNKMVKIEEELEWMKQYVFLQQYRFSSSFHCLVDYDKAVLGYRIHKLLLQPFIENAIIHGFAGVKSGGLLNLSVKARGPESLEIIIQDNGSGLEPHTLQALIDFNNFTSGTSDHSPKGMGLGIRNALERMNMYYGHHADYEITSQVGIGTKIRLILPIITP
jgi:two-component system sensor histidine kinase YesM